MLPALNAVRDLALGRAAPRASPPAPLLDIGASADRKLAAATVQAYVRMLLGPMQAQIAQGIDALMRGGADVNLQYEALKAYTMQHDASHFDAAALKAFATYNWDSSSDPPLASAERAQLVGHLDSLLGAGAVGSGVALDAGLVDSVRTRLNGQSPGQRVATRLKALLGSDSYPDFTVASLGSATAGWFVGGDGRSAPRAVPGRYTLQAYRNRVMTGVPVIAAQLAAEGRWVLGTAAPNDATSTAAMVSDQAAFEVLASYRADYARAWADFIDDVHLKRAASNEEAVRQAQTLAAQDGPLAALLRGVVGETTFGAQIATGEGAAHEQSVSEQFDVLRRFVSAGADGRSPLDAALKSFNELHVLRALAGDLSGDLVATSSDRLEHIRADARRAPEPVRSMLLALAVLPRPSAAGAMVDEPTHAQNAGSSTLSREIASKVGPLCVQSVPGRYPFDRATLREISFGDFAHLFAPSGAFDEVFGKLVAPHVDTSSEPWTLRDRGAGLDPTELERFRSAARIRDIFFARGRAQPALRLTFRPLDMDDTIDRFQLDIDGQMVRYAHGPAVATVVNWPGPRSSARLDVVPAGEGTPALAYSGPWAVFRLFDRVAMEPTASAARFHVVFNVGGRRASFEVESDSGVNPFRLERIGSLDAGARARSGSGTGPRRLVRKDSRARGFCDATPAADIRRSLGRVAVGRTGGRAVRAGRRVAVDVSRGTALAFCPDGGSDRPWPLVWHLASQF